MRERRARIEAVQVALLGISSLGLLGALALAFLAIIDSSDFIWWLWVWWLCLPFLIVALIVCSALLRRNAKPVAALLPATLAALPGFATAYFLAAVALQ